MKKKKFDIFRTFEIFNSESLEVIRQRIIKFVLIETDNPHNVEASFNADIASDDSVQMTVVNNQKLYNLLSCTWRKRQKLLENENIKC